MRYLYSGELVESMDLVIKYFSGPSEKLNDKTYNEVVRYNKSLQ